MSDKKIEEPSSNKISMYIFLKGMSLIKPKTGQTDHSLAKTTHVTRVDNRGRVPFENPSADSQFAHLSAINIPVFLSTCLP